MLGWSKIRFWKSNRMFRSVMVTATGLLLTVSVAGCSTGPLFKGSSSSTSSSAPSGDTIVIGGKNFTEQDIMANMMALLIQKDDPKLHVEMKTWLDSNVVWNAAKNGNIDVYMEYTGTGLVNILHDPVTTDPQKAYDEVKQQFEQKYQITWLKPIGFNNTYAMAMTQAESEKLGIKTVSDLAKQSSNLTLGTEQDFIERPDGLPGMNKVYGSHFKSVKSMDIGLKYKALVSGSVDVIDAFSTDGNIPTNHLVLLTDDKHFFPPYYAVPVIRDSVLKAHPELQGILNKLAGKIDDAEMQKLNAEVDLQHMKASDVAEQWLKANHLI